MTNVLPGEHIEALTRSIATLEHEIQGLKGHLRHQGELNQKLAEAFSKSAATTAIINETQVKLARRQGLFLIILTGQLRGGVAELKTLLQAIAANPETPASFAETATELATEIRTWTGDEDRARWIPEIVGGTDVEDPS